ncbi:MAG TPA: hypothetical protein PKG56_00050 [Chitinophagaceae bacterium]|nr:hypothetical protein [Chitinophagaceae bacterium]HNL81757.1 hypothetical protein [Chitinophagaceae bacterium]
MTLGYCTVCKRKLVPIGTARSNGKRHHGDWSSRTLHKKCWVFVKQLKEEEYMNKGVNPNEIHFMSDDELVEV